MEETFSKLKSDKTFTAIDFEIANERRDSPCAIGIARVENSKLIENKIFLIKPKFSRFSKLNTCLHGINSKMVVAASEFNSIWSEIKEIIECNIVVTHNAEFDINVLFSTAKLYNIHIKHFNYICSLELSKSKLPWLNSYSLDVLADLFNLNLIHHDCKSDALVCAQITLELISEEFNKKVQVYKERFLKNSLFEKRKTNFLSEGFLKAKKIESRFLKPNLDIKDTTNPFYSKKVVFTGDLISMEREKAAQKLQELGADIDTYISKKTNFVIVGKNPGPTKMRLIESLQNQGYNIKIINENQFLSIINN